MGTCRPFQKAFKCIEYSTVMNSGSTFVRVVLTYPLLFLGVVKYFKDHHQYMGAFLHRWESTYSLLQIPLDLEIRSASTPKHYFLHFPLLSTP
jgi:hypothetical protein